MKSFKICSDDVKFYLLAIAFGALFAFGLFGCSSVKKIKSETSSKTDSTAITETIIETITETTTTKKIDSSGITVTDKSKEYEVTTEIEFEDSIVSVNGNQNDYAITGKIKKITVHEKGKKTSQKTQTVDKKSQEDVLVTTTQLDYKTAMVVLQTSTKSMNKDVEKPGIVHDILSWWWLALIGLIGFAVYKFWPDIRVELFGKKPMRKV